MTKPVRTSLALLLGLLSAACGRTEATNTAVSSTMTVAPPTVTVSAVDQAKPIHLQPGQQLEVRLASNPSTGYQWSVLQIDHAILHQDGDATYTPDPVATPRPGSGGTEVFRFTAAATGATHLALGYSRPWEKATPPEQTYAVDIAVG